MTRIPSWRSPLDDRAVACTASAQAPTVLTAAVGSNMNHVPSFVGVEKGIFLKHGIDLKLKLLNTGQEMSKALQAGEVEIIGSAYSNFPVAVERGMAAKGVVGLMGDRTSKYSDQAGRVLARKGSGITRVEDLAGKKLGTPVGGTADEYLGVLLQKRASRATRCSSSTCRPATACRRSRAAAWMRSRCGSPSARSCELKVPGRRAWSARGGGHIGYFINMGVRNDVIEKRPEVVERYVIGMAEATLVHAPEPRRGGGDLHAVGAGSRGRGGEEGARATSRSTRASPRTRSPRGRRTSASWSSRRSCARRCRGSRAWSCASSRR